MSYSSVISHIQKVLNDCGDNVVLTPKGEPAPSQVSGQFTIEIRKVAILRQNKCCTLPTPTQLCSDNPADKYWINRIRISKSLADDYSINNRFSDDEMRNHICKTEFLFACFD